MKITGSPFFLLNTNPRTVPVCAEAVINAASKQMVSKNLLRILCLEGAKDILFSYFIARTIMCFYRFLPRNALIECGSLVVARNFSANILLHIVVVSTSISLGFEEEFPRF